MRLLNYKKAPSQRRSMPHLRKQKGFSLVEALVAFLVLSIGMLGIASLQVLSLKAGGTAVLRTVAVIKVEEMMELIRNNPTQIANYATLAAAGTDKGCNDYSGVSTCTPLDVAADDIFHWAKELKERLPNTNVTASIGVTAPDPLPASNQYLSNVTVTISWKERSTETQTLVDRSYAASASICNHTGC